MLRFFSGLLTGCILLSTCAQAQENLSLAEAERLALARDPGAQAFTARADALRSQATADGQLPDPRLRFGVENLSTRNYALDAEPMTALTVGVVQEFPRGRTRDLRREQTFAQAEGEEARGRERRLQTLRNTRRAWVELWYQARAIDTVRASHDLFERQVAITEAQYAAGRDSQQAVLEARITLARLADRESEVQTALEAAQAELVRWIGNDAQQPTPAGDINLPPVESLAALDERLPQHVALGGDAAEIAAAEKESQLARQAYRPGFALDFAYAKRYGQDSGVPRADLVTAMVEMDLPLFTNQRQDRRVAASEARAQAARDDRDDRLRELRAQLQSAYSAWLRLGERLDRYQRDVLPASALGATSADHAYRNSTADFATLVRARLSDLDARLEALRIETERARTQADLAYFAGELP